MVNVTTPQAREAVYQRWLDNVAPLGLDAWTFEEEEGFVEPGQDKKWARVSVRDFGGGQNTIGQREVSDRIFRRQAAVIVQVFTPRKGMGPGDVLGQAIRAIFEATSFSGLDFGDGEIRQISPKKEDKFLQTNVEVVFDYDETK